MIYIDNKGRLNLSKLHENQKAFVKSKYLHTGIVGGYQCLPGYTEYLTPDGWKGIDEYGGEDILVFDNDSETTHFEKPEQYISQPGGEFLNFITDTIGMEVTPNHKVLYSTEKISKCRVEEARALKKRVRIPRTFKAPKRKGVPLTDDEIRLQVAISADGHIIGQRVRINVKKKRKKIRLISLLDKIYLDYKIHPRDDNYLTVTFYPPILTKDLSFLFAANEHQLKIVADECRYWDGSVYECGSVEVSGIDKNSLDLIQYALTINGKATSLLVTDKREYKSGAMYNIREYRHNYSGLRYCRKEKTHHDRQYCFTTSTGFFVVRQNGHIFITGNSGKSYVAVVKVITHLLRFPGVPIAYYLPTYGLFEDMLVPKLDKMLGELKIHYTHDKKNSKIITPYGEVWMRSMDNPDRIVSYSVGYSVVDEADVVHPNKRDDAMKRISSRNSYKKDTPNQIDFVSTPEGFAYMYNFFEKNHNENKLLLRLSTLDNVENLADGYIQGLREQYTEDQLKAYLNGEFVNLTSGTVHYKFDREANHSPRIANNNETLYVGMDFNIGNMSAIIHVVDNIPIAVDEITEAYDTEQMCNLLRERYPNNRIVVYPDASGKNRKTNATTTDIGIIKEAGFMVKSKNSNPPVADRIKNMNRMFCNGKGEIGYKVNTIKCPEYTEALERQAYDKNGVPDKSSGFDHKTEAGGYFIWYEYPIKKRKAFVVKKR